MNRIATLIAAASSAAVIAGGIAVATAGGAADAPGRYMGAGSCAGGSCHSASPRAGSAHNWSSSLSSVACGLPYRKRYSSHNASNKA